MTRFAVTWVGVVSKTIAIEHPADALYFVWSRYRDDFAGGNISVDVQEGRGIRLAQVRFPVSIRREIEAENPAEAVRSYLYDDRVPGTVDLDSIDVEALDDPEPPKLAAVA